MSPSTVIQSLLRILGIMTGDNIPYIFRCIDKGMSCEAYHHILYCLWQTLSGPSEFNRGLMWPVISVELFKAQNHFQHETVLLRAIPSPHDLEYSSGAEAFISIERSKDRVAQTQSSSKSTSDSTSANDRVQFHSERPGSLGKRAGYVDLSQLSDNNNTLPPSAQQSECGCLYIYDVLCLAGRLSAEHQNYRALHENCYWVAAVTMVSVFKLFDGTITNDEVVFQRDEIAGHFGLVGLVDTCEVSRVSNKLVDDTAKERGDFREWAISYQGIPGPTQSGVEPDNGQGIPGPTQSGVEPDNGQVESQPVVPGDEGQDTTDTRRSASGSHSEVGPQQASRVLGWSGTLGRIRNTASHLRLFHRR